MGPRVPFVSNPFGVTSPNNVVKTNKTKTIKLAALHFQALRDKLLRKLHSVTGRLIFQFSIS